MNRQCELMLAEITATMDEFQDQLIEKITAFNDVQYCLELEAGEIQVAICFEEKFVDILAFPHPVIVNEENFLQVVCLVNRINWWIKSFGRLYVDDNFDIAYSVRLPYDNVQNAKSETKFAVNIYRDTLALIKALAAGEVTLPHSIELIDELFK